MGMLGQRVLHAVTAVLTVVATVVVALVAGGAPASAGTVRPCTITESLGSFLSGATVAVPASRFGPPEWGVPLVTDVDVTLDMRVSFPTGLRAAFAAGSRPESTLFDVPSLEESGAFQLRFDDAAPAGWSGSPTYPRSGTFAPQEPLLRGPLPMDPSGATPFSVTLRSTSVYFPLGASGAVTITSSICDSDGDDVQERLDNCPSAVNTDQVDWDADGRGNACDATPGTDPASVPSTPVVQPTTGTPTPPTAGCAAGCAYARTLDLTYRAKRHRLTGAVGSPARGCRSEAEVTLWRARKGADRRLKVVTTRATGAFRTAAPRRPGRYYATVATPDQPLCGAARSRTVRIRKA